MDPITFMKKSDLMNDMRALSLVFLKISNSLSLVEGGDLSLPFNLIIGAKALQD